MDYIDDSKSDYTTIEHDFLHAKDYLNNVKFTYKERLSKLDFLRNICCDSVPDSSQYLSSTKAQLVEVKNIYKELDQKIRNTSQELYSSEELRKEKTKIYNSLLKEEESLKQEIEYLTSMDSSLTLSDDLNKELDEIEGEIKGIYQLMDEGRKRSDENTGKKEERDELMNIKRELVGKQKRMTMLGSENCIEEIYHWNQQMVIFLSRIFGEFSAEISEGRQLVEMNLEGRKFRICIQGGKEANLSNLSVSAVGKELPDFFGKGGIHSVLARILEFDE